jgi:hypothetical protein
MFCELPHLFNIYLLWLYLDSLGGEVKIYGKILEGIFQQLQIG